MLGTLRLLLHIAESFHDYLLLLWFRRLNRLFQGSPLFVIEQFFLTLGFVVILRCVNGTTDVVHLPELTDVILILHYHNL